MFHPFSLLHASTQIREMEGETVNFWGDTVPLENRNNTLGGKRVAITHHDHSTPSDMDQDGSDCLLFSLLFSVVALVVKEAKVPDPKSQHTSIFTVDSNQDTNQLLSRSCICIVLVSSAYAAPAKKADLFLFHVQSIVSLHSSPRSGKAAQSWLNVTKVVK